MWPLESLSLKEGNFRIMDVLLEASNNQSRSKKGISVSLKLIIQSNIAFLLLRHSSLPIIHISVTLIDL